MKRTQRIFAWVMLFVLLLSGVAMQQTKPKRAVAATNKCYEFSYGKKVKVGKYYYRVNDEGILKRSKSKNKNFETVVTDSTAI